MQHVQHMPHSCLFGTSFATFGYHVGSMWLPFGLHFGTILVTFWSIFTRSPKKHNFLQMLSPFGGSKGSKMTTKSHKKRQKHDAKKHSERRQRKNFQKVTQGWPKGAIFMTLGILLGSTWAPNLERLSSTRMHVLPK